MSILRLRWTSERSPKKRGSRISHSGCLEYVVELLDSMPAGSLLEGVGSVGLAVVERCLLDGRHFE